MNQVVVNCFLFLMVFMMIRKRLPQSSLPDQRRGSSTWSRNGPKRWRHWHRRESDCNAWKPSKYQIRLHHLRKRFRPQIGKPKWMFWRPSWRPWRKSGTKQCETQRGSARQWVPGSIHPSNAHFGPSGTRRVDAGPSFGSAGCHDRGGRSASLGDHIEDGRRGRVFAANDRQFHGVMRKDRSARSRDSRYGLRGVRCGWVRRRIQAQYKHDRQGGHSTIE